MIENSNGDNKMTDVNNLLAQKSVQTAAKDFGKSIGVLVAKIKKALRNSNRMPTCNKAKKALQRLTDKLLASLNLHGVSYTT